MTGIALPPPPFELSESDKRDPLWLRLSAHLTDRLDNTRRRNDAPQDEMATAAIRGEIKTLKALISLQDARPNLTGE